MYVASLSMCKCWKYIHICKQTYTPRKKKKHLKLFICSRKDVNLSCYSKVHTRTLQWTRKSTSGEYKGSRNIVWVRAFLMPSSQEFRTNIPMDTNNIKESAIKTWGARAESKVKWPWPQLSPLPPSVKSHFELLNMEIFPDNGKYK